VSGQELILPQRH